MSYYDYSAIACPRHIYRNSPTLLKLPLSHRTKDNSDNKNKVKLFLVLTFTFQITHKAFNRLRDSYFVSFFCNLECLKSLVFRRCMATVFCAQHQRVPGGQQRVSGHDNTRYGRRAHV